MADSGLRDRRYLLRWPVFIGCFEGRTAEKRCFFRYGGAFSGGNGECGDRKKKTFRELCPGESQSSDSAGRAEIGVLFSAPLDSASLHRTDDPLCTFDSGADSESGQAGGAALKGDPGCDDLLKRRRSGLSDSLSEGLRGISGY